MTDLPNMNRSFTLVDGKPAVTTPVNVNLGLAIALPGKGGTRNLVVVPIKAAQAMTFTQFWTAYRTGGPQVPHRVPDRRRLRRDNDLTDQPRRDRHHHFRVDPLVMWVEGSYARTDVPLPPRTEITFTDALSEVITALLDQGLRITGWSSTRACPGTPFLARWSGCVTGNGGCAKGPSACRSPTHCRQSGRVDVSSRSSPGCPGSLRPMPMARVRARQRDIGISPVRPIRCPAMGWPPTTRAETRATPIQHAGGAGRAACLVGFRFGIRGIDQSADASRRSHQLRLRLTRHLQVLG